MALRDVVSGIQLTSNALYYDIQPTGTEQWAIHNIYHDASIELYYYDGSNSLKFAVESDYGWYPCHDIHCTPTRYVRVKNTSGEDDKLIGYDGVITHI
jgi:hypothetical protein